MVSHLVNCFRLQRSGTRRRYQDDGISDDEIEGKRSFDVEEKLHSDRYNWDLVKIMDGKGKPAVLKLTCVERFYLAYRHLYKHVMCSHKRLMSGEQALYEIIWSLLIYWELRIFILLTITKRLVLQFLLLTLTIPFHISGCFGSNIYFYMIQDKAPD